MIQIATALPILPVGSVRPVLLAAQGGASNFARALSSQVTRDASPRDEAPLPQAPVAVRQDDAEPGNELPGIEPDATGDEQGPDQQPAAEDDTPDAADLPFAWFALPASVPIAVPAGLVLAAPKPIVAENAQVEIQLPEAMTAGEPALVQPGPAKSAPLSPSVDTDPEPAMMDAASTGTSAGSQPSAEKQVTTAPVMRALAPAEVKPLRQPAAEAGQPLTVASLIAQSAVQAVTAPLVTQLRRAISEPDQLQGTALSAPGASALPQVSATPDAQQGTLDMRRQEWMGKMVETIEAMRDAGPVRETRISLVPDALGKVDISVRHEGGRVHVHFAAETHAARQILADAQPRLNELAEARGVRLGQTSVDLGHGNANAQSGQRHNESARPQMPSAPAGARTAQDQFSQTDGRVG